MLYTIAIGVGLLWICETLALALSYLKFRKDNPR